MMGNGQRGGLTLLLLGWCMAWPLQASDPLTPFSVVARPPIELRGLAHKDHHLVGVGFGTNIVVSTNGGSDWFVHPITLPDYRGAMAVTAAEGKFVAVGWAGGIITS